MPTITKSSNVGEVLIEELKPGVPIDQHLYHRTGTVLFRAGQTIRLDQIQALRESGVDKVFQCHDPADLARLKKRTGLQPLPVESLRIGRALPHDICNDNGVILLSRDRLFQAEYRDTLSRCGIKHVYVPNPAALKELDSYARQCTQQAVNAIDRDIDNSPIPDIRPDGPPFLERLTRIVQRSPELKTEIVNLRTESFLEAEGLLSALRDSTDVKCNVPNLINRVIDGFSKDTNFLLKLASLVEHKDPTADPRADHLINTCLNSLAIGAHLKYSESQMKQLGMCAFLHDIGMVRVPNDILTKPGPLDAAERLEVDRHTIFALDLLERIPSVDAATFLPIYQSHERPNGTGYPKSRKPPFIHEFARIIAVADAYSAMCAPRKYRAAKSPYQAMETIIQSSVGQSFDRTILRAFLHSVGLYPLGSWVLLNTGETARIVGTGSDPKRYDRPTVAIMFNKSGDPVDPHRIIELASYPDISIAEVMPVDAFPIHSNDGF